MKTIENSVKKLNKSECQYCDGEGRIETDNNGPIGDCPVCNSDKKQSADRETAETTGGDPSWHKCLTCKTQMEPIRMDELESRWKPFWVSLMKC